MRHRIVVLGAGYAGLTAAGRVARRLRDAVDVTVVNADPDFVERVRLHQLATGQDLPPRPLTDLLAGTGATLRVARVSAIDVDARSVTLAGAGAGPEVAAGAVAGEPRDVLGYDTLVVALGSAVAEHGVPGVREHAQELASRPGALRLRDRLAGLATGSRVVVVGGGLTGVEAATEIAEAAGHLRVSLVTDRDLGGWLSATGRRHLRRVFGGLGIALHERTAVERVGATEVVIAGGTIPADLTVWAGGFVAHPIASASALAVSDGGRVVVDETMRSVSHPDVYAVGDAALAPGPGGTTLRMSCASGIPMGWQAADAIVARLTGGRLPTMPLRYVQQCLSLGRRDGLIQVVRADDSVTPVAVGGRLAALYKELICRGAAYVVAHPTLAPGRRRGGNPVPDRPVGRPDGTDPSRGRRVDDGALRG